MVELRDDLVELRLEAPFPTSAQGLADPAAVHEHDQQHVQCHQYKRDRQQALPDPRGGRLGREERPVIFQGR